MQSVSLDRAATSSTPLATDANDKEMYEWLLRQQLSVEEESEINEDVARMVNVYRAAVQSVGAKKSGGEIESRVERHRNTLHNVLKACAALHSSIGYCQGLSFIASNIIKQMDKEEDSVSFWTLEHLVRKYFIKEAAIPPLPEGWSDEHADIVEGEAGGKEERDAEEVGRSELKPLSQPEVRVEHHELLYLDKSKPPFLHTDTHVHVHIHIFLSLHLIQRGRHFLVSQCIIN